MGRFFHHSKGQRMEVHSSVLINCNCQPILDRPGITWRPLPLFALVLAWFPKRLKDFPMDVPFANREWPCPFNDGIPGLWRDYLPCYFELVCIIQLLIHLPLFLLAFYSCVFLVMVSTNYWHLTFYKDHWL